MRLPAFIGNIQSSQINNHILRRQVSPSHPGGMSATAWSCNHKKPVCCHAFPLKPLDEKVSNPAQRPRNIFRDPHLGVLVGLGAVEVSAIDHGRDAAVDAGREPTQIAQVSLGRHISRQGVGVAYAGAYD
jgi:hypothetical protein